MGVLELKHTRMFWDEIPLAHQLQLQVQLGITGRKYGAVFALCGGDVANPRYQFYKFEQEIFNFAISKTEKFLEHIDNDTPPEAGSLDKKTLCGIVSEVNDNPIDLEDDEDVAMLTEKYFETKKVRSQLAKEVKHFDKEFKEVEAKLMQKMGSHKFGETETHIYKNNKISVKAKEVEAYEFFRFSVKEKK